MAFTWWSVLLYTKNRDAFRAKTELVRIGMVAEGLFQDEESFRQSQQYQSLQEDYRRQEWMIAGEAAVFVVTLIIGVWFINRGYNKEMQAAQQSRNFLLSITHELKSPLASIRLILDTFGRRELPREKAEQLVRSGIRESDRLHELVNNLLFSARLDSAYKPVFEEVHPAEIIPPILEKLKAKHPEVRFETQVTPQLPTLWAEPAGITSILLNLAENAVKYSNAPAEVGIHLEQKGAYLVLRVLDKGFGIPDAERELIFKQFYRVGNEDTRKTKGTGLGLYIVDQIVRAHQGRIRVRSNEPKGSIFEVELPLELNRPKTAKSENYAHSIGRG